MLTPEEQELINRVRAAQLRQVQIPPTTPEMQVPIDPRLNQADALMQQATAPAPQPVGLKQNVIAGLGNFGQAFADAYSGNPNAGLARQQMEQQRQQALLQRAQQLRGEAFQQQEFGLRQQSEGRLQEQGEQARLEQARHNKAAELLDQERLNQEQWGISPTGTLYNKKSGEIGTNLGVKPTTPKSGQRADVVFKDGSHGLVDYNPDLDNPVRYSRAGKDVTADVVGEYHPPAASIQMGAAQRESVPEWVDLIQKGQADLTDAPFAIRSDIVKASAASGNVIVPKDIRQRITDLEGARNLFGPIKELVAKIKKGENVIQNSLLLEGYTQSIGTVLARQVGQERGVATDKDVSRAVGLVPGWKAANFAPGYAEQEMALLEDVVSRQDKTLRESYFKKVGSTNAEAPSGKKVVKFGDLPQ